MSYDKAVAECLQSANRQKKVAMLMAAYLKSGKARKFFDPAIAMTKAGAYLHHFVSGNQLYLTLQIRELESFKSPAVEGILNVFEYLNPSTTSQNEYAASLNKDVMYRFDAVAKTDDGAYAINVVVSLQLFVKDDSPTCRKEVVGYTDGKPEPIYKIVCDDGSQAIDLPAGTTPAAPDHVENL